VHQCTEDTGYTTCTILNSSNSRYLQADLSIEGCLFFKQTKIHIYNETKIKRKNLAELKASMCVIDFEQQSSFVGGAYGDISDPYTWEDYSMVYK
jgi:hypothetical protein